MRTAAKIAEDYITVWNEPDATRRCALLESTWTPTATYLDPVAKGTGLAEIDDIIGSVQKRFPGFLFSLSGNVDGHANVVRFSWALGPKDGAAVVKGTDFVARDGDKIAIVTGFLDLVSALA
jgi:hypothetical protein